MWCNHDLTLMSQSHLKTVSAFTPYESEILRIAGMVRGGGVRQGP